MVCWLPPNGIASGSSFELYNLFSDAEREEHACNRRALCPRSLSEEAMADAGEQAWTGGSRHVITRTLGGDVGSLGFFVIESPGEKDVLRKKGAKWKNVDRKTRIARGRNREGNLSRIVKRCQMDSPRPEDKKQIHSKPF